MQFNWIKKLDNYVFIFSKDGKLVAINDNAFDLLKDKNDPLSNVSFNEIFTSPILDLSLNELIEREKNMVDLIIRDREIITGEVVVWKLSQSRGEYYAAMFYPSEPFNNQQSTVIEESYQDDNLTVEVFRGVMGESLNLTGMVAGYVEMVKETLVDQLLVNEELDEALNLCQKNQKLLKKSILLTKDIDLTINQDCNTWFSETMEMIQSTLPSEIGFSYESRIGHCNGTINHSRLERLLLNLCTSASQVENSETVNLRLILQNESLSENLFVENEKVIVGSFCILIQMSSVMVSNDFIEKLYNNEQLPPKNRFEETLLSTKRILPKIGGDLTINRSAKDELSVAIHIRKKEALVEKTPAYFGPPKGDGQCVLVVDDEEIVAKITERRLIRLGYMVEVKLSAEEALRYILTNPQKIDLLVTDHVMPGMTGLELAIKTQKIAPRLPIIMMTGYSSGITTEICEISGIKHLGMKPIDGNEFAMIVAQALQK